MRQVTLRQLRQCLTKELGDLPVMITSRGKTLGYIVKQLPNVKQSEPPMLNNESWTYSGPPIPQRYDRKPRDLSKETQGKGRMAGSV